MDDTLLLRRYVNERSEKAFAELVHRHLNLVYFAALRRVQGDTHRAEEIAQNVFARLARKAATLTGHPVLTGWLYRSALLAAGEAMRAEVRRREREQKAHAMNELLADSPRDANWDEVRPVIDDALRELGTRDQEAVLLRFFENRRYAEIAGVLRIPENSARMRVERAIEKLRAALAKRGVTSTSAALTAVLTTPSAMAAPAGLAQQIATTVLAGAAAAGTGVSFFTLIQIMTSTKTAALTATAVALLAGGVALQQHRQLTTARADAAALTQKQTHLQALVDNLEGRLAVTKERALKAEAAGAAGAAVTALSAPVAPTVVPANPVTRDMVEARLKQAKKLAASGQHAEALTEYLWCYDTGTRQVDGYFMLRYSSLLDEIADLGKNYPPALEALRARREAARERFLASTNDMMAGKDFGQINRVLGEDVQTNALFDSLAEDDPRRGHIVESSIGRLMEAQRYRELATAMPYTSMPKVWEEMVEMARAPAPDETVRQQRVSSIVGFAASQIELRAGAGDLVNASDLIERVLVFDSSPETVAAIKRHLARAGHPDLVNLP